MDFIESFLPGNLLWASNIVVVIVTCYLFYRLQWLTGLKKGYLNVWLMAIFMLGVVWMIRAGLPSGLNIHLFGAMLFTLMFGWRLGVLGMSLICFLVCVWGNSLPENLGLSVIINAWFAVTFCYICFLLVESLLPRNFFIYIFVTSFLCSSISFIATGSISVLILGYFDAYPWSVLIEEYLPFYYLMSFAEGFLSCGLITLMVVYRPQWVYSFRDKRYLIGK